MYQVSSYRVGVALALGFPERLRWAQLTMARIVAESPSMSRRAYCKRTAR